MKRIVLAALMALLVGCIGSSEARNPLTAETKGEKVWWRTPFYASTDRTKSPWEKFVPRPKKVNEFDPWAADDINRYSASPVTTKSVAKPRTKKKAKAKKKKKLSPKTKRALREKKIKAFEQRLQEYLRERRRREVY